MSRSGSSVWIQCRQCSHTSRALLVMMDRVLADRKSCPHCASVEPPSLHLTESGSAISLTATEYHILSTTESNLAPNTTMDEMPGFPQRMWRTLTELGGSLAARA